MRSVTEAIGKERPVVTERLVVVALVKAPFKIAALIKLLEVAKKLVVVID
jgi:hypothetical protein